MSNIVRFKKRLRPATTIYRLPDDAPRIDPTAPADWGILSAKIADAGGVALSSKATDCLWSAIFWYGVRAPIASAKHLTQAAQRRKLERIAGAAEALGNHLSDILEQENPTSTWPLISNADSSLDGSGLLEIIGKLKDASTAAANNVPPRRSSTGRPSFPGFSEFVRCVATIYHFAGGHIAANNSADGGPQGPFVRFVEAAFEQVTLPISVATPTAFGDAVRNELRRDDGAYDTPLVQHIANVLSE
ncbi:hypothetical protein [Sphingobium sp. GW456-12-10-14-TSB1]|uniref:hypothetical protein n=1 Tax=Sphingobium sp. GW456-12-10-14-TSB1 TaxID=1987165 RepID=UPI00111E3F9D|nr:hypothetical protein [Sphingobium sp. GW456-12-10-14-TSB1]